MLRDEAGGALAAAQARYAETAAAADAALAAAAQAADEVATLAAQLPRPDDAAGGPTPAAAADHPTHGVGAAIALLASLVGATDDAAMAALAAVRAAVDRAGDGGASRRPPSRPRPALRARDGATSPPRTGRRSRSRGHVPLGAEAAYAEVVAAAAAERGEATRGPGTSSDAA